MKKLLLALAILFAPSVAFAQCSGVFPANTFCGNNTGAARPPFAIPASSGITGPGISVVGDLALWNNLTGSALKDQAPGALTGTNDTNVTITLGGSAASALVNAASITMGWSGTLAAARLNANVVQGITNDTNVTGSIAAQNLTLGWTGTLAAARLNSNVVQGFTNDTNVTASITAQNATLGWTGQLAIARGGTGAATQSAAAIAILPTPVTNGDILWWNSSLGQWVTLAGNGTGTQLLSEGATGIPAWTTVSGTGTVTSVVQGTGMNFSVTPCTSSCTVNLAVPVTVTDGGTGNTSATVHTLPVNEGTSAQAQVAVGAIGQYVGSQGSIADPVMLSGPRTLLATLTASSSATLSDVTHFTSAYNEYVIVFENVIPATGAVSCEIQVHSGGSFQATSYLSALNIFTGTTTVQTAATTFLPCSQTAALPLTSALGVSGEFEIYGPVSTTTSNKQWRAKFTHFNSGGVIVGGDMAGFWNSTAAIDGIQILMSSGNITSGTVKIYGRL
jgi:hypothetical protein